MSNLLEENAKISSTMLGLEDHGILTFWIQLELDGRGQGFGGYGIKGVDMAALLPILKIAGVDQWEKIPGKHVRVRRDEPWDTIVSLGHIIEDKWFTPRDDLKQYIMERATPRAEGTQ